MPVEQASVDARHRHVGLDERRPTSHRPGSRPRRPRRTASSRSVPEQLQVGLVALRRRPAHRAAPDAGPRAGRVDRCSALQAEGGTATGDALDSALSALGERDKTSRRPRSCCSPTARAKTGARPGRGRARRPAPRTSRSTPSRSAPPTASSRAGGQIAARRRPTPRRCAQVARALRRPRVHRRGRRRARRGLRDARLAHRHQEGEARGQRRLRRARVLLALGGAAFTSLRWRGRLP